MKNRDTRSKSRTQLKDTYKLGWSRVVAKVTKELHKSNARKRTKSNADRSAELTARATVFIGIFTVVLAVIAYFQYLEVMHGGVDTSDLVDASRKQARSAQIFARSAANIDKGVGNAVLKLDAQAKATQKTADAAKDSADIAASEVELSERPRITVKPIFDPEHTNFFEDRLLMLVKEKLTNTGHSTATIIVSDISLGLTYTFPTRNRIPCKRTISPEDYPSTDIAPGDDAIRDKLKTMGYGSPRQSFITPTVTLCVAYVSASPLLEGRTYYVQASYLLHRKNRVGDDPATIPVDRPFTAFQDLEFIPESGSFREWEEKDQPKASKGQHPN